MCRQVPGQAECAHANASLATKRADILKSLSARCHVCSICENEEEQYAIASQFILIGLERGEQCIYIADEDGQERSRAALSAAGVDVAHAMSRSALVMLTTADISLKRDPFDLYRMFSFLKKAVTSANRAGFPAMRGLVATAWLSSCTPGFERWVEYEQQLAGLTDAAACSLLCQYNRQRFAPDFLVNVVRAHQAVIHRDMTEIQPRTRAALESSPIGFMILRAVRAGLSRIADFIWLYVNPAAAHVLAQGADALIGRDVSNALPRAWSEAGFLENAQAVLDSGQPKELEVSSTQEISQRFFHVMICPLNGDVAVWATEITERRRAEHDLRAAQAELARTSRMLMLGVLTASIAHEVAQPLASAITNGSAGLRWLNADPPNLGEARAALMRVIDNGRRASDVIERIGSLARHSHGAKALLDVNEVVVEVIALIEDELTRNRVLLEVNLDRSLPLVPADRVQLQQVLLNLMINAMEAINESDSGQREIVIQTSPHEVDDVRVDVRDSGVGLEPEILQEVFRAFYTTKPRGMGIGLSISRNIVEAHGGRLWATQNEGERGATFHFTLPLHTADGSQARDV
jgi:C4-dicarboxylate-specific signal transduction histidine kinase